MTQHDLRTILAHMLEYASRAIRYGEGRTPEEMEGDEMRAMAVTHAIVILGEAANRADEEQRKRLPAVPWSEVVRLRNRIVHGYDTVDFDIVAEILRDDLPPLIDALREALEDLEA